MSDQRTALLAVLLVIILAVLAWQRASSLSGTITPRGVVAAGVAAVGGVWLLVNEPLEGPILFIVAPGHGITVADLPAVALWIAAAVLAVRRRR